MISGRYPCLRRDDEFGYACALKLTAVRVTRRRKIITAPMTTMTPGGLGADERRPVEDLRLVEQAEELGGIGDGERARVAAQRGQPRIRGNERGAGFGNDAGPPPRGAGAGGAG
jgi:hypothetical protein